MKILHRVRATFAKEVEIPDELWKRRFIENDEEAMEAINDIVSKHGCDCSECEKVEDEWYEYEIKES